MTGLPAGWGMGLALVLLSCSGTEETLDIVIPDGITASSLVVTVLDPTANAEVGLSFASCDSLGPFAPIRRLDGSAAQADAPSVLRRFEAELPVEGADFRLPALRATADNPWGVIAVLVEAVGQVVDSENLDPDPAFEEASILQSCYCARTLAGRHPDPELDARVKAACPFVGGAEGTEPADRELRMGAVAPEEFVLEPCGNSSDVLLEETAGQRGAPACIRTLLCEDVAPGNLCFDCPNPCPRVGDLSGAMVQYRVVTGAVQPERQVVATDSEGQAWPVFSTEGCRAGEEATVEASVPGRRSGAIRFSLRCVAGRSVEVLAGTDEILDADRLDNITVPASLTALPGDASWVLTGTRYRIQAWQRDGDSLQAGPWLELRGGDIVEHLFSREGPEAAQVVAVRRVAFAVPTHRIEVSRIRWTGAELEYVESDGQGQCEACTCGSRACGQGQVCEADETCIEGSCRPPECPCFYQPRNFELNGESGDFDGDGTLDVLLSAQGVAGSSSFYGAPDGTGGGCRCDLNVFGATDFIIADLDADGRDDTVWQRGEGPALRSAQDPIGQCGGARPLGEPLFQPVLGSASLRCEASSSCQGTDLVAMSGFSSGRVLFADPAILDGDPRRFDRPQTHSRFVIIRSEPVVGPPRIRAQKAGDFNGDGYLDLAFINRLSIEFLLGDGRGNLVAFPRTVFAEDLGCPAGTFEITSGDTDGDGVEEAIIRCGLSLRIAVLR
ncbi:MAG: VCBS repeat-containing protein [Myxococcota bacterium]